VADGENRGAVKHGFLTVSAAGSGCQENGTFPALVRGHARANSRAFRPKSADT
jgi:hypothetical protein